MEITTTMLNLGAVSLTEARAMLTRVPRIVDSILIETADHGWANESNA
ncbi:hypothetical protein ACGFJC_53610 [Nonomuraea fuscirosea]